MNLVLSVVFYVCLSFQYYLLGNECLDLFGYNKNTRTILISGFLSTFFLTFIIGFVCQILHLSWTLYFILQSILFVVVDGYLLFKNRKNIFCRHEIKLQRILKNNWVLILFAGAFISFSIANQLPYYDLNYDDVYYIGKVVNHVGTPHLMNENYFNGSLIHINGFDLIRVINTYELSYSYFGTLFHIYLPYFCRVTMSLHNYVLFGIVYKQLASLFVKEKYSQYAIVPFFYFLIPAGFLQTAMPSFLKVYSYDLWQFQTASFYGGSIVRMVALPILIIYSLPLVEKMEFKKIVYIILMSISMVSFSTIYIQIVILFFIAAITIKCIYCFVEAFRDKKIRMMLISLLGVLLVICMLLLTKYLDHFSFIDTENFVYNVNGYHSFQVEWYNHDPLLTIGLIVFVVALLVLNDVRSRCASGMALVLYVLISKELFIELLTLTSFNYFFVSLRTVSAVQYLIVFFLGVNVLRIYQFIFKKKYFILKLTTVCLVMLVCMFFRLNVNEFVKYNFLGSGISAAGWKFSRVFDLNTKMIPDIFVEVGDYFNGLPYDNYKMYTCTSFNTDGGMVTYDGGFEMSTNRLHVSYHDGFKKLNEKDFSKLNSFCVSGNLTYTEVHDILKKENIQYILVFNKNAADILECDGDSLVLSNEQNLNPYYLLKVNY